MKFRWITLSAFAFLIAGCGITSAPEPKLPAPIAIPKYALSKQALEPILPQGTKPYRVKIIRGASHAYAVVVTQPGQMDILDQGWIAVGAWDQKAKRWSLEWIHRGFGGGIMSLVLGPTQRSEHSIAAAYIDGATGAYSTISILGIRPKSVQVLRLVSNLASGAVNASRSGFTITGADYLETDSWSSTGWSHHTLSTKQILDRSTAHVFYVEQNYYDNNMSLVHSTKVIGSSVVHIKVGQSVSFIPADYHTWSLLGGTEVFYTEGVSGPINLDEVDKLPGNAANFFSNPGVYRFAIDPPGNYAAQANGTMAQVTVIVSK